MQEDCKMPKARISFSIRKFREIDSSQMLIRGQMIVNENKSGLVRDYTPRRNLIALSRVVGVSLRYRGRMR